MCVTAPHDLGGVSEEKLVGISITLMVDNLPGLCVNILFSLVYVVAGLLGNCMYGAI